MEETDPALIKELSSGAQQLPMLDGNILEDQLVENGNDDATIDNSDLPMADVIEHLVLGDFLDDHFIVGLSGRFMLKVAAETLDVFDSDSAGNKAPGLLEEERKEGRGKRVRKINWLYSLSKFWQYDPDASSDNKRLV
jgi:hypothetical protein